MQTIVNRSKRAAALLVVLSMLLSMFSINVFALEGTTAVAQGFSQTAILFDTATETAHNNVTVVNSAVSGTNEGTNYFLNRVESVYDISGNKDLKIQIKYSAGMNAYSDDAWKSNGARYFSVIDVKTGKVVANWANDGSALGAVNARGAYQVSYAASALAANVGGIIYTIPHAALEYNHTYWVVTGSATCGNNNQKMLFAPIIYEITTSGEDGTGTVTASGVAPKKNTITVETVGAETADTVKFNRLADVSEGSQVQASYSVGEAITSSIVGQEIPLVITSEKAFKTFAYTANEVVQFNAYTGGGSNASSFNDYRFTMPNADVKVKVVFGDIVNVTSVDLAETAQVSLGGTTTLTATVAPDTATVKDIIWTSSDESVATVKDGVVSGLKEGTVTITAKTVDGAKTDTCTVTVVDTSIRVTGVTLDKETLTVDAGTTADLVATIAPADATNTAITWKSSDETVATVSNGKITAIKPGNTTITVTTEDGSFTDTCEVTVSAVAVTGVTLDKEGTIPASIGKTVKLTATVAPDNSTNKNLVWTSSDDTKATVADGVVTGVAEGTTTITVKTEDGAFSDSVVVEVSKLEPDFVDGYYQLKTADQVQWFADKVNAGENDINAKLIADIDLGNLQTYTQIGYTTNQAFQGVFDGNNHTVTIAYSGPSQRMGGIFNYLKGATVKNLKIDGELKSMGASGALASVSAKDADGNYTVIENVANYAIVDTLAYGPRGGSTGGIISDPQYTTIKNCANYGTVKGSAMVGGITGTNSDNIKIYNCANYGMLEFTAQYVWSAYIGGIVGYIQGNNNVIYNCFNVGSMSTGTSVPGMIVGGSSRKLDAKNVYFRDDGSSVGISGGTNANNYDATQFVAKTTDYMNTADFITDLTGSGETLNRAFVAKENDYPILRWLAGEDTATITEVVIATEPTQTVYDVHETFKTDGMLVQAKYSDGTAEVLTTSDYTYTPTETLTTDVTKIDISYNGMTVSQPITVYEYPLEKIEIKKNPTKTLYTTEGEAIDLTGLQLIATYTKDGVSVTETLTEGYTTTATVLAADMTSIPVSYTYNGVTQSVDVPITNAYALPMTALEISTYPTDTVYEIAEVADITGLKLNATFGEGDESKTYTISEGFELVSSGIIAANTEYLKVSYTSGGLTKIVEIPVLVNVNGAPELNKDGYYEICDEYQFDWFASQVNGGKTTVNAILIADLDLTRNRQFIGTGARRYAGTFDGNGYSLEVAIVGGNNDYLAVFPYVAGGTIKNLTVNGSVKGGRYAAGLVASIPNTGATIINCVNNANIIASENCYRAGGIVAENSSTNAAQAITIKDCVNNGNVSCVRAWTMAGGIIGNGGAANITYCTNTGNIVGYNAGGIAGTGMQYTYVTECINKGDVAAAQLDAIEGKTYDAYLGGIVGNTTSSSGAVITDCYNTGDVDGGATALAVGGICGGYRVTVTNCYTTGNVTSTRTDGNLGAIVAQDDNRNVKVNISNSYYLDGTCTYATKNAETYDGVTKLTSDELKAAATKLGDAFRDDTTPNKNSGYPILKSQIPATAMELTGETAITDLETATLTVTATPEDGYLGALTWTSSDETIATVTDGVVTPVTTGTVTITVTSDTGFTDSVEIVITCAHDYLLETVKEATCTEEGKQEVICQRCGDVALSFRIPLADHSFTTYVSNNDATCTSDGTKTATCDNCDATDTIADEGSMTAHTPIEVPAKAPTITEVGNTAGHKCDVCGTILDGCEEIPVLVDTEITVEKAEDGNWYAYQNGEILTTYTGFADNEYGTWYVENGQVTFGKNDIIKDTREGEGDWKYVVGSKFTVTDTVAKNSNGWWRVEDGIVNFSATGVYQNEYGWWYCKDGQVQFGYTGIQNNENGWWRIVGGKVDFSATGVFKNEFGWWYCKDGKVDFSYTGVQKNDYGWWRIESGKVNFDFTGIAANEYGKWYCVDGKVDFSYSGLYKYNGTYYSIKDGKVV